MIEVLVALVILMVGLLGLAGLMVQSQRSEMESYQRVQALILLKDMVSRINANRNVASCYVTPSYRGTGSAAAPACAAGTLAQNARAGRDLADWDDLLKGAAETSGGTNIGAMVDARGCVSYNAGSELLDTNGLALIGSGIYTVEVVWRGTADTAAPPAALSCGKDLYGAESRRRDISLTFRIASINNPL